MMKALLFAGLAAAALAGTAEAGNLAALLAKTGEQGGDRTPAIQVDWQDPAALPRQFRNHCTVEAWSGRPYCEDHCGRGYQFFYCTTASFGCCRVGHGYCDWHGHLRCYP